MSNAIEAVGPGEEKELALSEEELKKRYDEITKAKNGKTGWFKNVFGWDHKAEPFNPQWLTEEEYLRKADEGVATTMRLLTAPSWRLEKRGTTAGDLVQSTQDKHFGKVFKFTGTLDCPAKWFFEHLRDHFSEMPSWNPTIIECHHIKQFHPGLDLAYQVTSGGGGGIVSERDFVLLRRLCALDAGGRPGDVAGGDAAAYIISGVSVEVPGYPPGEKYVRGDTKIGSWILKPTPAAAASAAHSPQQCIFEWLFCCDLKGRMPQFVVDTAFATVMLENVEHIRKHAATAKEKGLY